MGVRCSLALKPSLVLLSASLVACSVDDGSESPGFSGGSFTTLSTSGVTSDTNASDATTDSESDDTASTTSDGDDDSSTTSGTGDGDGDTTDGGTTSGDTTSTTGTTGDGDGDTTGGGDGDGDTTSTTGTMGACGDNVADTDEDCDGSDLAGATCNSLGHAGGTLVCNACVFDETGCRENYFQGFENGAPGAEYALGGDGNWTLVSTNTYMGATSAASPASTSDSSEYWAELTLTYDVPGSIRFARRTSTESTYDDLRFYIDNSLQDEWNGENAWAMTGDYAVSAGTHTFRFTYYKDISLAEGSDRVWLDDITATNGYVP
jgi:hypothetical protein